MRVVDYFSKRLYQHGLTQAFMLTGGGAMHLNDALARYPNINVEYLHHEQSMSMAAEGYARSCNKAAIVNVTTGPGGINALNGVFGAFVDSIPMIVLSGQVKTQTIIKLQNNALRQLGDQEADIFEIAKPIVKYVALPKSADEAIWAIENALFYMEEGRKGPVWIDLPVDVQAENVSDAQIERVLKERGESLQILENVHSNTILNTSRSYLESTIAANAVLEMLKTSNRPLILVGNGIRYSKQIDNLILILENLNIPIVTGWNAHDILSTKHPCFVGKPGTIGDRPGNFATYNADFILILGCRMNIRQVSYNWTSFGARAKLAMVDIDIGELNKPTIQPDLKIHIPLESFLPEFVRITKSWVAIDSHKDFLEFCRSVYSKYPILDLPADKKGPEINPYNFFKLLYRYADSSDVIILANGSACVIGNQMTESDGQLRIFTNSGCASMGYDLPAAIGAALAIGKGSRVICVAGDGSIMQNIQELSVIHKRALPIKIFILENGGYHSINQTQKNYFPDNLNGTSEDDGLCFPDFCKVFPAFGLDIVSLSNIERLDDMFSGQAFKSMNPQSFLIHLDKNQLFEPKLMSRMDSKGKMTSPELHDMYPFLPDEELSSNIITISDD